VIESQSLSISFFIMVDFGDIAAPTKAACSDLIESLKGLGNDRDEQFHDMPVRHAVCIGQQG
jgi:hypothetical protein